MSALMPRSMGTTNARLDRFQRANSSDMSSRNQDKIRRARRLTRKYLAGLIKRICYDGQLGQLRVWFHAGALPEDLR